MNAKFRNYTRPQVPAYPIVPPYDGIPILNTEIDARIEVDHCRFIDGVINGLTVSILLWALILGVASYLLDLNL